MIIRCFLHFQKLYILDVLKMESFNDYVSSLLVFLCKKKLAIAKLV